MRQPGLRGGDRLGIDDIRLPSAAQDATFEVPLGEAFSQEQAGRTLVDMMALDLIVGSGGVLSHAYFHDSCDEFVG